MQGSVRAIRSLARQFRTMSVEKIYYPRKVQTAASDASLTLNHTSFRIKDPKVSVPFYEKHFGMQLLQKLEFPEQQRDVYVMSFPKQVNKLENGAPGIFHLSGTLHLAHSHGTENDAGYRPNNGNEEPHRGFGHICFSVADLPKECERLEAEGVAFKKRMSDGRQKNIAFALDPDGYWIELIQYNLSDAEPVDLGPKFNHTMLRVKDATKSLEFYQNVLGMSLLEVSEHANAKFTLYFLGYPAADERLKRESILELTHNWGTEDDADFSYHNGNAEPTGYSHMGVSLSDPAPLCADIEETYPDLEWELRYNKGSIKNLAVLRDPDGYHIQVLPRTWSL
ncbi:ADR286Cp [Eremothecium gossypii ATCC 10895]|uniref:Lactoylglutathione lyase n=1 Tax=Eremothecium gossypii (strain ATCC 10895 / CBS 109.51 / FGSC 9923 / NRRL Y-1056) TaxID=284811 RepID=Q759J1_EREGS|nr:ADR286Cp [Eremothecium gossypii ATCC 10895]AAS52206.1 ADR286Cp [Eremothecium gossypii ATCC 10895]AEY96505.1 FADR286Cp [Eremothecium gossypii FDAG1]